MERIIANNLKPFEPTHPGDLIKEEIEFRGMTVEEFSEAIGIEIDIVKDIIDGRHAVTGEFAERCENIIGIPKSILINMQTNVDDDA